MDTSGAHCPCVTQCFCDFSMVRVKKYIVEEEIHYELILMFPTDLESHALT